MVQEVESASIIILLLVTNRFSIDTIFSWYTCCMTVCKNYFLELIVWLPTSCYVNTNMSSSPASVAQLDTLPTGDQEV